MRAPPAPTLPRAHAQQPASAAHHREVLDASSVKAGYIVSSYVKVHQLLEREFPLNSNAEHRQTAVFGHGGGMRTSEVSDSDELLSRESGTRRGSHVSNDVGSNKEKDFERGEKDELTTPVKKVAPTQHFEDTVRDDSVLAKGKDKNVVPSQRLANTQTRQTSRRERLPAINKLNEDREDFDSVLSQEDAYVPERKGGHHATNEIVNFQLSQEDQDILDTYRYSRSRQHHRSRDSVYTVRNSEKSEVQDKVEEIDWKWRVWAMRLRA